MHSFNTKINDSDNLEAILKAISYSADQSLQEAISMPAEAFTSDALLQLEREKLFSNDWICVGRVDELQTQGDYFTTEVNQVPIVVVRNNDDVLQALVNVCRHRMGRIMKGEGTTRVLTCPYHSWAYDLDGKLINAPKMEDKQFDKSKCGLQQLRLEQWLGFIFVNLDSNAAPLAPRLESLKTYLNNFHIEKMNVISKTVEVWNTNWKILCENFLEVYHIESVHRDTLFALGGAESAKPGYHCDDYNFYLYAPQNNSEASGDADLDEIVKPGVLVKNPDLTDFEYIHSPIGCIYPNLLIALSWFGGSYMSVQPLSTGEVRVENGHFAPVTGIPFNSEASEEFGLRKLNDLAGLEDREIVEGIYSSAESGYGLAGPLHIKHEETIHHFIRYISGKLANSPG